MTRSKILITLLILLAACAGKPAATSAPPIDGTPMIEITPTVDRWVELLERTPYPWSTPLPPVETSPLDDTYVKLDPSPATPFPCRRCPDYALDGGGVWKLSLDDGIFRIYFTVNGWRSLGSFTVSGDHIFFFNDPNCPKVIGEYQWRLENGALTFKEINDTCSIHLRAENLVRQPWLSCRPPNREAAVSDHWLKPAGCQ